MSRWRSCRKDAEGEVEETGTEVEDWGKRWERWDRLRRAEKWEGGEWKRCC